MTELRRGDRVAFAGVVDATFRDGRSVNVTNADGHTVRFAADFLELVERPGPCLEDLPDGTVVSAVVDENRRATSYVKLGHGATALVDINEEHGYLINDFSWPFDVIGACPGTPAWEMWTRNCSDICMPAPHHGEWWRSE